MFAIIRVEKVPAVAHVEAEIARHPFVSWRCNDDGTVAPFFGWTAILHADVAAAIEATAAATEGERGSRAEMAGHTVHTCGRDAGAGASGQLLGSPILLVILRGKAARVGPVHRIVADIGVEVHAAGISDRVRLQEPAEPRVIVAALVIVNVAQQVDLAGIGEAPGAAAAALAIFVVDDDPRIGARRVARGDDRSALRRRGTRCALRTCR